MRWGGQRIDADGIGEAAALPGLRGLLRSVSTPEFAGMVFHEVEAKSALNKVPGESALPFSWTVNPYRGCTHACTYCLSADTPIPLAGGGSRPLGELRAGDAIYGTERDGLFGTSAGPGADRRYAVTRVLARWTTVRPAYRIAAARRHRAAGQRGAPVPHRAGLDVHHPAGAAARAAPG